MLNTCLSWYPDFEIWERPNGDQFVITKDGTRRTYRVKEVMRLDDFDYFDTEKLLNSCSDYDYSGETEDWKHYCFWKVIHA